MSIAQGYFREFQASMEAGDRIEMTIALREYDILVLIFTVCLKRFFSKAIYNNVNAYHVLYTVL